MNASLQINNTIAANQTQEKPIQIQKEIVNQEVKNITGFISSSITSNKTSEKTSAQKNTPPESAIK